MRFALSIASLAFATALPLIPSTPARACGGFFCSGGGGVGSGPGTVIVQGGERVVFAQTPDGVTMHVEVRYAGDPTKFGWLLPVPRPSPAAIRTGARPFTLDAILSISSESLFDRLDSATAPTFSVIDGGTAKNECNGGGGGDGCSSGCGYDDAGAYTPTTTNTNSTTSGFGGPRVWVADEAEVGPYQAQLIEAERADDLYAWLEANGFYQDPAARPLLQHYIDDDWGFLALRLQAGRSSGDLRPIALHLAEGSPCVPLRLTAIAATEEMPIVVWVLGPHRAVPKNFLNAVINDRALTFPGAPDYVQRVSEAVDQASGHAWVTEMSGPFKPIRDNLGLTVWQEARFDAAQNLVELIDTFGYVYDRETRRIWLEELVAPAEVPAEVWAASPGSFLTNPGVAYVHDLETLKDRLREEILQPRRDIDEMFLRANVITRLFTVIDPFEMNRDPIFAFNAELPAVSNVHRVTVQRTIDKACTQTWRAVYDDGTTIDRVPFTSSTDSNGQVTWTLPSFADESPLGAVELLDEEGPARAFDPKQAADVDQLLDDAELGLPSLPANFTLRPPPRTDREDDSGCNLSLPGAFVFLPIGILLLRARRLRREPLVK